MTDKKISELPTITGANLTGTDLIPVVDVSSNATSKVTRDEFFKNVPANMEILDSIVHSGDTNTKIRFPAADTVTVETAGTERMRIDSAGHVLIGTASSTTDLAYAPRLKLSGSGPSLYLEETDTAQAYSISTLSGSLVVRDATAPAARITITSAGNVGIGTSDPNTNLEVVGAIRTSGAAPRLSILDTGGATNEKEWSILGSNGPLRIQALNDAGGGGGDLIEITRVGNSTRSIRGFRSAGESYDLSNFNRSLMFSGGVSTIGTATAHDLVVDTNNSEAMRITSAGLVGIGTVSPRAILDLEGNAALDTDTATLTTTSQTSIATFAVATFDAAKVIITANDGTDTYITELLVAHDGTTAVATEYGQLSTGTFTVTYDVDISGGNVRILATPPAVTSTTFKVIKTLM